MYSIVSFLIWQVIGDNEVAVPTHLYKVVVGLSNKEATPAVAAFIVPNAPLDYSHHLTQFQVPLDQLERKVGLKFCRNLNRQVRWKPEISAIKI